MITDALNRLAQKNGIDHVGGNIEDAINEIAAKTPAMPEIEPSDATTVAELVEDFNALVLAFKESGVIAKDAMTVSALKCPSTGAMPTETTAANSAHIDTIAVANGVLTITLNCKVADLAVADHGATWGKHKWIGFGIRSGFASVVDLVFQDDTGAKATLTADDAGEATTVGLSAGDFVLYIKAEDSRYLAGVKYFWLKKPGSGYADTKIRMKIVEAEEE